MKKKKGIPVYIVALMSLLCILIGLGITYYSYLKYKYTGESHVAYSKELIKELDENSLDYKLVKRWYSNDEINEIRNPLTISTDASIALTESEPEEANADKNGDGIIIEHVYGNTYEGYMMVITDPEDVSIEINPTGGAGPSLDWYVENYNAAGGINGGGFEDVGGKGDGSVPQGLVIKDGKIVHGSSDMSASIVGITKDHKLITTYTSGANALAMDVVEAVTFGPTFIEDGTVVYTSADAGTLNMLNPRTAVGQKADGTFLLLVVDGRGPSSWGAKYEDIIEIFKDYGAINAGNLDGGNSSVMMYDDQYVHYPVSMYNSRNLPSVILVKEGD